MPNFQINCRLQNVSNSWICTKYGGKYLIHANNHHEEQDEISANMMVLAKRHLLQLHNPRHIKSHINFDFDTLNDSLSSMVILSIRL